MATFFEPDGKSSNGQRGRFGLEGPPPPPPAPVDGGGGPWGVIRSRGRGNLGVAGERETRAMHWCVECGQSIASKRVYGRKIFGTPTFFLTLYVASCIGGN